MVSALSAELAGELAGEDAGEDVGEAAGAAAAAAAAVLTESLPPSGEGGGLRLVRVGLRLGLGFATPLTLT